ncbi:MAG: 3-deoxy-manno-octulosonate cytidylyltransferase, partial [Candidatus Omnitrophica bacterium]|nr:3-deoxy-manno-octulosonate cytidylyltransferase [Candidatus Omnitrophota bacterium]
TKIRNMEELYNPNITKVVFDKNGFALYFSASVIPYPRAYQSIKEAFDSNILFYKHIGLYSYRKSFLDIYNKMPTENLERLEKLEQLRIMENGYKIKVVIVEQDSVSIDTLDDLKKVNTLEL